LLRLPTPTTDLESGLLWKDRALSPSRSGANLPVTLIESAIVFPNHLSLSLSRGRSEIGMVMIRILSGRLVRISIPASFQCTWSGYARVRRRVARAIPTAAVPGRDESACAGFQQRKWSAWNGQDGNRNCRH
jgi:hypothetical protein